MIQRMNANSLERIPFLVAGTLVVVGYALLCTVGEPSWTPLLYLGWVTLVASVVLIGLPLFVLPRTGRAPRGSSVTETTTVVHTGLYALVRHPLYLGWMLGYVALFLLAQHWLVAVVGLAGIACVYLISVQEERRMLDRFGGEYARYMRAVPRVNLLIGIVRLLRRRMGH
jgi:protein-S-isoprenylcysteine O-methyltransferase Ste14